MEWQGLDLFFCLKKQTRKNRCNFCDNSFQGSGHQSHHHWEKRHGAHVPFPVNSRHRTPPAEVPDGADGLRVVLADRASTVANGGLEMWSEQPGRTRKKGTEGGIACHLLILKLAPISTTNEKGQ